MKIYKKILIFLICISLCISVFSIINIYAKYSTSASGSADIPIAKWNIKVNDSSIKNSSDFSSTISPIFLGNDNIASNIIAPTSEGYFDLSFDFSDADVSFSYSISTSVNEQSSISDLIVTGYSIDNGDTIDFDSSTGITDTIGYSDNIDSRVIRIYIKWDDSTGSLMDNAADTAATNEENAKALLDVVISFTQIVD